MKKILAITLLSCSSIFCFSQTEKTEDQRITEIEIELKKAVEDKDYDTAADLKKEKELLTELKDALVREDYKQAAFLKQQIEDLKNPTEVVNAYDYDYSEDYKIGASGFFLGVGLNSMMGYDKYYYSYNSDYNDGNYLGVAVEIGNKWYFGNNEKYMPGLQLTWLKLNVNIGEFIAPEFALLSPLNVGFSNLIPLNDKIGLEMNLNGGITVDLDDVFFEDPLYSDLGYNITPEVRFVINQFSIGVEYSQFFINEEVAVVSQQFGYDSIEIQEERGKAGSVTVSCNFQF